MQLHCKLWNWSYLLFLFCTIALQSIKLELPPFFILPYLAFRPCVLLSSPFVRRLSFVVHPSTFHILIFSSETTGPIATKLWWNDPWMAPFQKCVRWFRLPTKMATKLEIEKRGDEIWKKSSPLKLLSQSQQNFAEMILGWSPSKIMYGIPDFRPRWPPQPNLT